MGTRGQGGACQKIKSKKLCFPQLAEICDAPFYEDSPLYDEEALYCGEPQVKPESLMEQKVFESPEVQQIDTSTKMKMVKLHKQTRLSSNGISQT